MKTKIYTSILILVLSGYNCSRIEDFGDTNTNPLTTNVPATGALLTAALIDLGWVQYLPGYYCQYFSEVYYSGSSCYSSNHYDAMSNYTEGLFDLQNIINTNTDSRTKEAASNYGDNENQIAIARILKVYNYWIITDLWGDVPYKDALKGKPEISYDTQESIYEDMLKELTEAVSQIKTGNEIIPVAGDIIYDGDTGKWKRFANSLRMLIALNLSKRYQERSEYAALQFRAALDDPSGSIESNSDNFQLNYPSGSTYKNPFYFAFIGGYTGESETVTSLLTDYIGGDLRQMAFGSDRNGNPSNIGVPYGRKSSFIDPWAKQNPNYCVILSKEFRSESSPFFLLTASSVLLARAEAADRGWTNENTSELYKAGITESFRGWSQPDPDESYFERENVALGTPGTNLKQIAIQQYLAAYPDGHLGWNIWRRTGYPELVPAPDAINTPRVIPRRIMYGSSDYSLTAEGIAEAVARLAPNGDKMDSRVWWDKE